MPWAFPQTSVVGPYVQHDCRGQDSAAPDAPDAGGSPSGAGELDVSSEAEGQRLIGRV